MTLILVPLSVFACENKYDNILGDAIVRSDFIAVEKLLLSGADPNAGQGKPGERISPLSIAIGHKNIEMMKLLIKYGADPNLLDGSKTTPIFNAMLLDCGKCAELLISEGGVLIAPSKLMMFLHARKYTKSKFWADLIINTYQ